MVLELQKEKSEIWKNLFQKSKKPKGMFMRIWWEMKNLYPDAMKQYSKLLEEDEDEEDAVSLKKLLF
jgi:hypothetical protein